MKVICKFCDGQKLSKKHLQAGFSNDTSFDVGINSEYLVYGVSIWRNIIFYLICDDYKLPNWYPAEIFKLIDSHIPNNWKFTFNENSDEYSVEAIFGYPELIDIEDHYVGLIERDKVALEIFANLVRSSLL